MPFLVLDERFGSQLPNAFTSWQDTEFQQSALNKSPAAQARTQQSVQGRRGQDTHSPTLVIRPIPSLNSSGLEGQD